MVDRARAVAPALSRSYLFARTRANGRTSPEEKEMDRNDWTAQAYPVGHRVTRQALRSISALTRTVPDGPEIYKLTETLGGGWCKATELIQLLQLEAGLQELLMRYGAISKNSPLISIAIPVYDYNGESAPDITWKNYEVDWTTLAASNGSSAVLTWSDGQPKLLELQPKAPLMVPAGWAKEVIFSFSHGITHTFRRAKNNGLVGIQYDGHEVENWLPK